MPEFAMFEIVDEIVQAEKQAEQIVSDAKKEAEEIRTAFDAEERQVLAEAREEAARQTRERLDRARKEADERRRAALAEELSAEQYLEAHAERAQRAVDRVVDLLVRPEYER
ncbi:MAG: hypothetical protein ACOCXE_01430 [Spirochaetota bacterium]